MHETPLGASLKRNLQVQAGALQVDNPVVVRCITLILRIKDVSEPDG
jgi:hypothetical protein